ncbi:MAG TPA: hypothetical protein VF407_25205 [Polyangiaceae bacterium]
MRAHRWQVGILAVISSFALISAAAKNARADEATVSVGDPDRFAQPPTYERPVVVREDPPPPPYDEEPSEPPPYEGHEAYRAPFRLTVGPVGVTSGRGLGLGLGVGADFGTGTVGARISGAWARGERSGDDASSASDLGTSMGQYTGELTLDLHKRGPVHPVFGVGFGLAHVSNAAGGGNAGIGVARLGVEYSLALSDADVRLGAGVTGALTGPEDKEIQALRGYALVGAQIAIGF